MTPRALDINLFGAVRGCRAFMPLLEPGAQIVMTASIAGLIHPIKMSTYNATKAAVVTLAETLLTAATVADRAMKGIDARRQVVTPDSMAVLG